MNTRASFAPDVLLDAAAGDTALAAELLAIFVRTAPLRIERLAAALEAGRPSEVARQTHELKSNLAMIGAASASAACAAVETAARRQGRCPPPAEGAALCEQLRQIVDQVARYAAAFPPQA